VIGISELFMPAYPEAERTASADDWREAGAELGAIAQRLSATGLALGYHNHHWELTPFADGTTSLEHFFAGAEGSPLTFEADLAWLVRGAADPVAWMRTLASRLTAVHVKDLAPEGDKLDEDGWAYIGEGTMDWPDLWRKSLELGAKWMILEHDKPNEPLGFAEVSRNYLLRQLA
jgi:sugar phosphate isomerase/epimerase